jgi:hypothetical protein
MVKNYHYNLKFFRAYNFMLKKDEKDSFFFCYYNFYYRGRDYVKNYNKKKVIPPLFNYPGVMNILRMLKIKIIKYIRVIFI